MVSTLTERKQSQLRDCHAEDGIWRVIPSLALDLAEGGRVPAELGSTSAVVSSRFWAVRNHCLTRPNMQQFAIELH